MITLLLHVSKREVGTVLALADLTRGTGRFNLTNGAMSTAAELGASLSHLVSGLIVQRAGYEAAFVTLVLIAAAALARFWIAMPETATAATS